MTITDEQVIAQRLDLEMLERPHLWPQEIYGHAAVFLKRGADSSPLGYEETGPCLLIEGKWVVVGYHWPNDGERASHTYDSAEAVLADGWMVD